MIISTRQQQDKVGLELCKSNRGTRFDIHIAELEPASKEITSPVIWEFGKSKGSSRRLSAAGLHSPSHQWGRICCGKAGRQGRTP